MTRKYLKLLLLGIITTTMLTLETKTRERAEFVRWCQESGNTVLIAKTPPFEVNSHQVDSWIRKEGHICVQTEG